MCCLRGRARLVQVRVYAAHWSTRATGEDLQLRIVSCKSEPELLINEVVSSNAICNLHFEVSAHTSLNSALHHSLHKKSLRRRKLELSDCITMFPLFFGLLVAYCPCRTAPRQSL